MKMRHYLGLALALFSLNAIAAETTRVQLEVYPGLLLHRVDGRLVDAYRAFTPSRKTLLRNRGLRLAARPVQAPPKSYAPTTGKKPMAMDWSLQFPVPKTAFGLGYVYVAALESSYLPQLFYKNDVSRRAIRILHHHAMNLRQSVAPSGWVHKPSAIASDVSVELVYGGVELQLNNEEKALVSEALRRDQAWLQRTLSSLLDD